MIPTMGKQRGFVEPILVLVLVAIFAMIGYVLLLTTANAAEAAALNGNVTAAGASLIRLGPTMLAVSILLAIIAGGFGVFAFFRRG